MDVRPNKMELSDTISLLAAANQQLAAAHNFTLNQLRSFLVESREPGQGSGATSGEELRGESSDYCANCARKDAEATSVKSGQNNVVNAARKRTKLLWLHRGSGNSANVNFKKKKSMIQEAINYFGKEVRGLNTFKLESQLKIDRLIDDLEKQKAAIHRVTQDFEVSRRDCARKEARPPPPPRKPSDPELEGARLLAELEAFRCEEIGAPETAGERDTADLRARLAEQDAERQRLTRALAEAAKQIRSLELLLARANTRDAAPGAEEVAQSDETSSPSTHVSMGEFKKELMLKREARQRAIAAISAEMDRLRRELESEKVAHAETAKLLEELREAQPRAAAELNTDDKEGLETKTDIKTLESVEALRLSDLLKISDEITSDLWLQLERTDDLRFQLENNPDEHRSRIDSLKRLSEETRATLRRRKEQINALKDRLAQILVHLGDRAFLGETDDVREEIERQTEDIARSRNLNDERMRILAELKDHCSKEIHEIKLKFDNARKDNQSLEEDLRKTEDKLNSQDAEMLNLESQLGLAKADCRDLQNQMSVINSLFTQMLLSASSAEMDLDRLTRLLQENHDLISYMAKENGTEAAALPKLLLDIIKQVDGRARENEEKTEEDDLQEESIAHNLPKVWRVLLELLSCHAAESSASGSSPLSTESAPDSCYKSVDTPTGPRLVISVSKTYIRLKELILEKKSLEKEMNRMKQLNTHLESKLSEQEKRLSTVSDELSKTWNIVGRMQAQHQQLHTHEKILRYELQQKRKMLQELKQELEYCREKWESARQKNTNTEIEWRSLRKEFAARKALLTHADSFNTSGESGFSDEREEESDEDEDEEEVGKRIRPLNSRRRSRKDESRAITPDTESEHPTDNEFSESKTVSTRTSEQRVPTPETEAELENSEVLENDLMPTVITPDNMEHSKEEVLNPLDEALTNVIQNLIATDESKFQQISDESNCSSFVELNLQCAQALDQTLTEDTDLANKRVDNTTDKDPHCLEENNDVKQLKSDDTPTFSVFSIGPIPTPLVAVDNVISETEKIFCKVSELCFEVDNTSIDSSSSLETVKECLSDHSDISFVSSPTACSSLQTEAETNIPEVVTNTTSVHDSQSAEAFDARAARLRVLEEQAQWLVKKVSATNRRGSVLNSRLEELHETYGSIPAAPPMPDVLPSLRLRCEENESVSIIGNNANITDIRENEEKEIRDDAI